MNKIKMLFISMWAIVLFSSSESAHAILITGNLAHPDAFATHSFVVPEINGSQPSRVRIRSLSYGGGNSVSSPTIPGGPARLAPVASGGFDVILGIFDGTKQIAVVDDASVPGTRPDPFTGAWFDSAVDIFLPPGTYDLRVTNYDNFSGGGRTPGSPPDFSDVTGAPRTSAYAVEVLTFADVINNSVDPPAQSPGGATAAAVFSLAEAAGIVGSDGSVISGAAEFGGFHHFNWFQELVSMEGDSDPCRGLGIDPLPGGNCDAARAIGEILLSFPPPISDVLIGWLLDEALADQYKWYWDETDVPGREGYHVRSNTTGKSLNFEDEPRGFEVGAELIFHTYLAGVQSGDAGAIFASPTFQNTAFKWKYTQTTEQRGAVSGIQFYQNGFFDPVSGGAVEFLGFMTEEDWVAAAPRLRGYGLDVYGLDTPVQVSEPQSALLLWVGVVGLAYGGWRQRQQGCSKNSRTANLVVGS